MNRIARGLNLTVLLLGLLALLNSLALPRGAGSLLAPREHPVLLGADDQTPALRADTPADPPAVLTAQAQIPPRPAAPRAAQAAPTSATAALAHARPEPRAPPSLS